MVLPSADANLSRGLALSPAPKPVIILAILSLVAIVGFWTEAGELLPPDVDYNTNGVDETPSPFRPSSQPASLGNPGSVSPAHGFLDDISSSSSKPGNPNGTGTTEHVSPSKSTYDPEARCDCGSQLTEIPRFASMDEVIERITVDARSLESALGFQDLQLMGDSSELNIICAKGLNATIQVTTTRLQLCARTQLRLSLSVSNQEALQTISRSLAETKEDFGIGLRLFLVVFTNATDAGESCDSISSENCAALIRRIVLLPELPVSSLEPLAWSCLHFLGEFMADPSSVHYSVVVEWDLHYMHSNLMSPAPFAQLPIMPETIMSQLLRIRDSGQICHSFLHRQLPYMHDFLIRLVPDGGLVTANPSRFNHLQAPTDTTFTARRGSNQFFVTFPPALATTYPEHVRHASFFGRLLNQHAIVNVFPELRYNDELQGYLVEFDLRDPGVYWLQLGVDWYFGDSEPGQEPVPQCVSGFQGLQMDYRKSDERRALIHWGREIKIELSADQGVSLDVVRPQFSMQKCQDGNAPGRWLNMGNKACEPPYCSGDRFTTVNDIDWDAFQPEQKVWVWVPYTCYYHLYSKEDLFNCAKRANIDWIHTIGDSQQREFVSMLKQVNGSLESNTPYSDADFIMHGSNLRVTFTAYADTLYSDHAFSFSQNRSFSFDKNRFDSFNIFDSRNDSGQEQPRPSVFLMNHGNGGSTKYMNTSRLVDWMTAFGEHWQLSSRSPDGLSVFGPGRSLNQYVTSYRVQAFALLTDKMATALGARIVDTFNVTKSRWDSSWDGIHMACQLVGDNWGSQIASMNYQIVLNAIFPECTGNK